MRRRGVLRARFAGRAAALLILTAHIASADYKASYVEGIKAIDNKDWTTAVAALRAAAAEKSTEGERILIYGMRFKPYLPHYYLGLAYFNTGNCQAALKALAESERQGAVRQLAEYRSLQTIQEQCRGQGVREPQPTSAPIPPRPIEVAPGIREAEAEIRRTETIAALLARQRNEPDGARIFQDPVVRQTESKATVDLASARALLADARAGGEPARVDSAKETALRARQEFENLQKLVADRRERIQREALEKQTKEREAKEREAALERQAREREAKDRQAALEKQAKEKEKESQPRPESRETRAALAEIQQKIRDAQELLAQADRRQPRAAGLGQPRRELEAAVEKARRGGPTTSLSDLRRLSETLAESTASFKKISAAPAVAAAPPQAPVPAPERRPPATLLEAASAYFQADYGRAAKILEGAQFSDARAAAQARLLRGAARFGVFVTGGGTDERLRQQAIEDVRECVRLDPKIVVSARAFSPRFVEFFKKNAAPTGG